jgi:hypothetical protein
MITTTVDVSGLKELAGKMLSLQEADSLLREISTSMLAETKERIHESGLNADGRPIGSYSDGYLKLREKNKLGSDRKVILRFNADMENNYGIVPISDTEYGLGFTNPTEGQKADWVENTYRKNGKIYALTDGELDQVKAIVAEFVANTFK